MNAITINMPWPPSINSMYQVGIIGAKKNLEEPFVEVLRRLAEDQNCATIGDVLTFATMHEKDLRTLVKSSFGSPRASMFLSAAGKEYRDVAAAAIAEQKIPLNALHGRLEVSVMAYPPDERIRDLSNLWKSALDILQHNQVIENDGNFDRELIERGPKVMGGSFVVTLREKAAAFESRQQDMLSAPAA